MRLTTIISISTWAPIGRADEGPTDPRDLNGNEDQLNV
jgi:hypothetical protein